MNWNKLISQFLNGDTNAIQAVFTILGFIVGVAGTFFVARSFRQQTKINAQQYELNRIAGEKHRRAIRPNFQVQGISADATLSAFKLKLTNAIALNITLYKCNALGDETSEIFSRHNAWEPGEESEIYQYLSESTVPNTTNIGILKFTDEDGVQYYQCLKYKNAQAYVTFPKLVNEQ